MIRANYFRYKSESETEPSLTVGGSICGAKVKTGEIDVSITSPGGHPGIRHTVQGALTLDEAEALAKTILSEVSEVRHKLNTGKWMHELPADEHKRSKVLLRLDTIIREMSHHSKTANHFYRIRERLRNGHKLTKKMRENIGWIVAEVQAELDKGDCMNKIVLKRRRKLPLSRAFPEDPQRYAVAVAFERHLLGSMIHVFTVNADGAQRDRYESWLAADAPDWARKEVGL